MEIRQGSVKDIETIRHLACLTWPAAYANILSAGQLSYMLDKMYSPKTLAAQITEEGHQFFLAISNNKPVGFADISKTDYHIPALNPQPAVWKLHKLYVLPSQQKTGTGRQLLQHTIQTVKVNNGNYLILNVNRNNPAYHYYEKNGFEIIETGDFDIGEGFYMNDHIMGKAL